MNNLSQAQSKLLSTIKEWDYLSINSNTHCPLAKLVKGDIHKSVPYNSARVLLQKDALTPIKYVSIDTIHYQAKEVVL
jgi:hypothetical protein